MTENLLKKSKKKKGFTLIELIVVIAIIAIMALIAIPKVMGYQDDAKKKADIANAKTIANSTATLITNSKITTPATGNTLKAEIKTAAAAEPDEKATPQAKAEYQIAKNLQSIPTMQYKTHANNDFWVLIKDDGSVIVYAADPGAAGSGVTQVYPTPADGDYK